MKSSNEPAFATSAKLSQDEDILQVGMSKRFYAACAAMQGILANGDMMKRIVLVSKNKQVNSNSTVILTSYQFADELLKQEYEEQ